MERLLWKLLLALLLCKPDYAVGAQWRLTPSLSFRETYSDNINLEENGTGAWVTQVNPGLSANAQGGRLKLNLNYRMQNLFSTQSNRGYDARHQLRARSTAELIENSIFLDARASAGQTLIDTSGRQVSDNVSNAGNRSNFYSFGLSPYWRPYLGGYANGLVRLRYDYTTTSSGQASATQTISETVNLNSGHRFTLLTWQANFNNRKSLRANGEDVTFRNGSAFINYRWTRKFSTFVRGGFNDSDTQTSRNSNGLFYTVGVTWTPSRMLRFRGGYGRNSFATLTLQPTRRTMLQGTFRHTNVGTNTGNTFQALIRHRTRRTVWQGRYFEDTTISQTVLAQQQIFALTDSFGNPILNPATSQPALVAIDLPRLVDETFVRKRGQLSFTGRTAKSTFTVRVYAEKRMFDVSDTEDKVLGLSGNWTWRWSGKTRSLIRVNWQQSKSNNSGQPDQSNSNQIFWTTSLRINRRLSEQVNAFLEYRHQEQSSKSGGNFDYQENRGVAGINIRF